MRRRLLAALNGVLRRVLGGGGLWPPARVSAELEARAALRGLVLKVDAVELDEIFLEEEEERFGLPVMEDVQPGTTADSDSDTPSTTDDESNGNAE